MVINMVMRVVLGQIIVETGGVRDGVWGCSIGLTWFGSVFDAVAGPAFSIRPSTATISFSLPLPFFSLSLVLLRSSL